MPAPSNPALAQALRAGADLEARGAWAEAEQHYRGLVASFPDEDLGAVLGAALVRLGDSLLKGGKAERALDRYREAEGLLDERLLLARRQAHALIALGRHSDAVALLRALVGDYPDDMPLAMVLGEALYSAGQTPAALTHYTRALELAPEHPGLAGLVERLTKEAALEGDLVTDLGARHFTIKYDGTRDVELGRLVGRVLEEAYVQVGQLLGHYPPLEVAVVIYPGRSFQQATGAHAWVAGLYDGKIRVPASGLTAAPAAEVRRVLFHEYAHALISFAGGAGLPAWLQEGVAQVAEGRSVPGVALSEQSVPELAALQGSFATEGDANAARVRYAASFGFVRFLLAQGGTPLLSDVLTRAKQGESVPAAVRGVYGRELSELYAAWRRTLP